MRCLVISLLLIVLIGMPASAGLLDGTDVIAGTFYEESKTSAALGVRVPLDSDGDVSGLLIGYGETALKGNLADKLVGTVVFLTGEVIKHGGIYAVAPIATYTDGQVSTNFDTVNVRLGLGAQFGPEGKRINLALTWKPETAQLKPSGVFIGLSFLTN